jgi:hypothetical protein
MRAFCLFVCLVPISLSQRILQGMDPPAAPNSNSAGSLKTCSSAGSLSPPPPVSPGGSQRLAVRGSSSKQTQPAAAAPLALPCSPSRRLAFKALAR